MNLNDGEPVGAHHFVGLDDRGRWSLRYVGPCLPAGQMTLRLALFAPTEPPPDSPVSDKT